MKNFNLLISTSRFNESNAKAELWFTLLILGDNYPIISNLEYLGLITALTNIKSKKVIQKVNEIHKRDPYFFQYILKIVPIDFVCDCNIKVINYLVKNNFKEFIQENEKFKIELKRRKNKLIERDKLITTLAKNIKNEVNLDNPDKIIRIELLGNYCGIAFIKPDEVLKLKTLNKEITQV